MSGFIKCDVEYGVDSSGKLGSYLSNEVDAVGFINKKIAVVLTVKDATVVQHDTRSVLEDREMQRLRMKGNGGRFVVGLQVEANLGSRSLGRRWASISILFRFFLSYAVGANVAR